MPGFLSFSVARMLAQGTFPRCATATIRRLLPRRLAQRLVDAVLPAGAAFLEIFQHVLVDPQASPAP